VLFAVPQRSMNYIVPIVAEALGFFDEAGLDVRVEAMQSNLTVAALQRGDLQISGSGGSAIRAAMQGAPLKLVSFMTVRPTWYLYMVPDVRTPAQLVGKRIGVSQIGASQHFAAEIFLREQGMEPAQVQFVAMGTNPAQVLAGLQAGALDAAVFDPGSAAVAEKMGYALLKSLGEVLPQPLQGMVATEDYIQKSPDTIRAFLRGIVRGLVYTKQHPREVAAVARQELGHDMDEATALRAVQLYADTISAEAPGYADAQLLENFYHYDVRLPLELPADQPIPVLHDFRFLLGAYDDLGIPRPR
jgi:NitT/TauT family transport system substrate-binding protein